MEERKSKSEDRKTKSGRLLDLFLWGEDRGAGLKPAPTRVS